MDVVYLCKANGDADELRYSLRSLSNIPHDDVWLFGTAPQWIRNVNIVNTPQDCGSRYKNTTCAMRLACEHPDVSDPFLMMNDDFFIVKPLETVEPYHRGPIRDVLLHYLTKYGDGMAYAQGMTQTRARLQELGYDAPVSYELHIPLVVHKSQMLLALDFGKDIPVIHKRTMYGNIANLGGEQMEDVKLLSKDDPFPQGPFLSSLDGSFSVVRPVLRYLFPDESPYCDPAWTPTPRTQRRKKRPPVTSPISYPVPISRTKEPFEFEDKVWKPGDHVDHPTAWRMKMAGHLTDDRIVEPT